MAALTPFISPTELPWDAPSREQQSPCAPMRAHGEKSNQQVPQSCRRGVTLSLFPAGFSHGASAASWSCLLPRAVPGRPWILSLCWGSEA